MSDKAPVGAGEGEALAERAPGRNRFAQGVAATLAGGVLWGFSGSCIQFLGEGYAFPPLLLVAIRMLGAGAIFLVLLFARNREEMRRIAGDAGSLARIAVFGCAGLLACQLSYIVAINYTNAGTATVLASASIVICMVATCLIERRLPLAPELAGLACAVVAEFFIATGGNPASMALPVEGVVAGFVNAATLAFYVMYPRRLFARWSSLCVIGLGMFAGGVCASVAWALSAVTGLGAAAALPLPVLDAPGVLMLVVVVAAGTFGAFGLYLHGVSIVGGVRGSQLGAIEPVSAVVFTALWLGTAFSWADWLGLALMVATVFLVARQ